MKNIIKSLCLKILNLKLDINELDETLVWQNVYNFEEPFPHFIKKRSYKNIVQKIPFGLKLVHIWEKLQNFFREYQNLSLQLNLLKNFLNTQRNACQDLKI